MVWTQRYCILICLMVQCVISTTGEAENSTNQLQEYTSYLKQDGIIIKPPQTDLECSEVDSLHISKLFYCETSDLFERFSYQLQSSGKVQTMLLFWMSCWTKPCAEKLNKVMTLPQIGDKVHDKVIDNYLSTVYFGGITTSQQFSEALQMVSELYDMLLNSVKQLNESTDELNCLSPNCTGYWNKEYDDVIVQLNQIDAYYKFRKYIHPAMLVVIFFIGILWNVPLIIMFVRNKELKIIPNAMILNITICNMLLLVIGMPLQYFVFDYTYPEIDNQYVKFSVGFNLVLSLVSVSSVLAMSIQRYCAISKPLTKKIPDVSSNPRIYVVLSILAVWLLPTGVVTALYLTNKYYVSNMDKIVWWHFGATLVIAISITIAIAIFYLLTLIKLKKNVKDIPGETVQSELLESSYKSFNIIIALTGAFWFTHLLFLLRDLVVFSVQVQVLIYLMYTIRYMYFSITFLNPIALFIASIKFRTLFKKYIFIYRCW